jgi:hypothetical protein
MRRVVGAHLGAGSTNRRRACALVAALMLVACGGGEEPDELIGGPLGAVGAHEHGVARISIAFDADSGAVEIVAPAAGVYGFEHEPRTDEERRQRAEGLRMLRERIGEAIVLEPSLGCTILANALADAAANRGAQAGAPSAADHAHGDDHAHDPTHTHGADHADGADHAHDEGGHREVEVQFQVRCDSAPTGTRVRVEIGALFPAITEVDLRVLTSATQFGRRVPATGAAVRL